MITDEILLKYDGYRKLYPKGSVLFHEGQHAKFYFQVLSGEIKMFNNNDDGKEFIQGIFTEGDSFGEPPLLNGQSYLTNSTATLDSEVWLMSKENFTKMLTEEPDAAIAICRRLSDRLYYKSMMAVEISSEHAEHRLLRFFDFLKFHVGKMAACDKYHIDLTRQELADLTGLRVETVIRAVKNLEKQKAVTIEARKIFR